MKNDLTQGNIWKKLSLFFLPLAIGTIFQQLYNAADGLIVGKYVGTIALAAVGGSAAALSTALVNFFVALGNGGTVLIAQFFGASNHKSLTKAVHTSLIFAFVCGVIISIVGYIKTPEILAVMKVPDDTMADAICYLRIIFAGVIFQVIFNMGAGILRAIGDSRSPFIYLTISCITNIFVDLLFVKQFQMGVAGAAYATIMSQALSCFLTLSKLVRARDESYGLKFKELKVDFPILKRMLSIGLPIGCQSLMYSITNVIIQVGINSLGTVVVASWALAGKFDGFFWGIMSAANTSITNFVGQNYGKGDFERIKKGIKISFVLFMGFSVIFCASMLLFSPYIIPLFGDDQEVIECTWSIVKFFGPLYWIWTINEVFSGALRGEGKTLVSFVVSIFLICGFRLFWYFVIFRLYPTLTCLSLCYPISWAAASIAMTVYYLIHIKRKSMVQ